MMNGFQVFRLWVVAAAIWLPAMMGFADDIEQIRGQFKAYWSQQLDHELKVTRLLTTIDSDGAWADLDYVDPRLGEWPALDHLKRLKALAAAYANRDSRFYQDPTLNAAILKGMDHWIENDYRNDNWWYARIGVPQHLGTAMVLMGTDLPQQTAIAAEPILRRCEMGMTGQNKVWCAGNNFMIGLLYDERELMGRAVEEIWSELRISTKEGIQPDWSFHQHGAQQQFGNYGLSFAGDMIKWGVILRGTDYALSGKKMEILRNYMLKGAAQVVWKGRMDISGCGRQVDENAPERKGRTTIQQLKMMPMIDPEFGHAYIQALKPIGFQPFWRSEMGVQRRDEWYASVKMSSERVIGAETCNAENMQGLHLGDGTMLMYQTGVEYRNIIPVWDWKRLPGTTCDQGLNELVPLKGGRGKKSVSNFSGVLGDGETGVASMIYKRHALAARKAYFFLKDHVVCLGAGISGSSKGTVVTSVQQSWLNGAITQTNEWVHHDGIAYQFMTGKPQVMGEMVAGNWDSSFPMWGDHPASGEVFSVWIDHGKSPDGAAYAYRVFPQVSEDDLGAVNALEPSTVLVNSEKLQAIVCGRKAYAVFYEAGLLQIGKKWTVKVDGPCLMHFGDGALMVSDPTWSLKTLTVNVNGKSSVIDLPQGAGRGSQVVVK